LRILKRAAHATLTPMRCWICWIAMTTSVLMHVYGLIHNIRPILVACRERGISVVEDAAQAFGATLDGSPAGTIGEAGIFSFGLLKKVIGFVGGAVITKNRDLEAKIRADLSAIAIFPRSMLLKKLDGVAVRDVQISHHRNCASTDCFAAYRRDCLNAEHAAQCVICLPTYPGYGQSAVAKNIEAVRQFLQAANQ
jgi:dTDP-4-amino-4,6-dideoxygalactose transaminase